MHGENVERIVDPKPVLDHPGRDATRDAAHDPDRYGADRPDIARRLSDGRYSIIAGLKAVLAGNFRVPEIRALYEATFFVGLRKAGMPEE
jgi:hypothetical protein